MPSKNSNSAVKRQLTEIALITLDSKDQDLADIVRTNKGDILICKSYEDFTAKREKADPNKAAAINATEIKVKKIVPFSISAEVIYLLVFLLQTLLRSDNEQLYSKLKAAINYISDDKLQLSCHKIDDFLSLSEFKDINNPLNRREILITYTRFIIYICNKIITDIIIFKKKASITTKLLFNIITDLSNIKNCNIFEELYTILKEHISSIPKITKKKGKVKAEDAEDTEDTEDAEDTEDTEDANANEDEDANANKDEDANGDNEDNEDAEDEDANADNEEDNEEDNDLNQGPIEGVMGKKHKQSIATAKTNKKNDSSSDSNSDSDSDK